MGDLSKKYAQFIDELRIKRQIKVKDLCDGICNERSYRRYVSGERTLPSEKIIEFCEKLRLSPNDFHYMFFNQDQNESHQLSEMLHSISHRDFDKYRKIERKLKNRSFTDLNNERLYKHLQIKYELETNKIDDYEAIIRYSKLIDFPNCANSEVFDYVDIITLLSLMQLQTRITNPSYTSLNLLEKILINDSIAYMSFSKRHITYSVFSAVAVGTFRKKDYDKAMKLCDEGIKRCQESGRVHPMANMYAVRSAIHYINNNEEQAYLEAQKCLSSVIVLENYKLYSHYINLFRKRYGEEFETYYNTFHQKHYTPQI